MSESVAEQFKKLEAASSADVRHWNTTRTENGVVASSNRSFADIERDRVERDKARSQLAVLGRNHMGPLLEALGMVRRKMRSVGRSAHTYELTMTPAEAESIRQTLDAIARDLAPQQGTNEDESAKEDAG